MRFPCILNETGYSLALKKFACCVHQLICKQIPVENKNGFCMNRTVLSFCDVFFVWEQRLLHKMEDRHKECLLRVIGGNGIKSDNRLRQRLQNGRYDAKYESD